MKAFTPNAINERVIIPIKEYCKNRNYRCKGCAYSVHKPWINDIAKNDTCIFANCPCSWDLDEKKEE